MDFRLMRRMLMLMAAMLSGMLMVMHMGVFCMSMLMGMLVQMLVRVRVSMLMQVDNLLMLMLMTVKFPMGMLSEMLMMVRFMFMLMAVRMRMLVRMQMFMFVLALHGGSPFLSGVILGLVRELQARGCFAVRPPILYFQGVPPNAMDITISQRVQSCKFLDLVNLETDIGVGVNRRPRSPAQIDQLVILLHPI
jgi:hypothetical protein